MIWFRKKATGMRSPHPALRTELLCEQSLATLADLPDDDPDQRFARFTAARASVLVGDRATARRHLHDLLALPEVTTREQLLAWNCLRELDEMPPAGTAAAVRGVVVDIGSAAGLETLAAWDDRTARVLCRDGTVFDAGGPDRGHDDAIRALLAAGRGVVEHTHPHRGAPENAPEVGQACIRVLTFAGTHVGLGPIATLEHDAVGGPVLRAAKALRGALERAAPAS